MKVGTRTGKVQGAARGEPCGRGHLARAAPVRARRQVRSAPRTLAGLNATTSARATPAVT